MAHAKVYMERVKCKGGVKCRGGTNQSAVGELGSHTPIVRVVGRQEDVRGAHRPVDGRQGQS